MISILRCIIFYAVQKSTWMYLDLPGYTWIYLDVPGYIPGCTYFTSIHLSSDKKGWKQIFKSVLDIVVYEGVMVVVGDKLGDTLG